MDGDEAIREENRLLRLRNAELGASIREAARKLGTCSVWTDATEVLSHFVYCSLRMIDGQEEVERKLYKPQQKINGLTAELKQRDRKIGLLLDQATCREIKAVAESL